MPSPTFSSIFILYTINLMEYSNKFTPKEPSFWRLCDEYNRCHCDYRVTTHNCIEANGLYFVNVVEIVLSAIAATVAFGILYFRVFHKNQPIFDTTDRLPRPKPVESMFLCGGLFNLFRLIHSTILVTDIAKNGIFRSFMFDFSWQFGIIALACYLFGVVHTLANSSRAIYISWVKSQMIVDIACILMVISPFITIIPISIVAGYYIQVEDIEKATICTNIVYYLWSFFTFLLGCMVLLAGLRLLRILNTHLFIKSGNLCSENIEKMKSGATKVKMIISIGCISLWTYTFTNGFYAITRHNIMTDSKFSVIFTSMVLFNGPLATCLIELAVLINLKMFRGFSQLSFGTTLESTSHNTKQSSGDDFNNFSLSATLITSTCENRISTTKDRGSQLYVKKHSCDKGVRSTITSETIQLDT
ncbi:hypothetical protein BJ944DRAFT_269402 [Cunninghamella echinulata]|nr:hypothetical protein BJ944DRAFT_269402 [Cunninghamella echinulata]